MTFESELTGKPITHRRRRRLRPRGGLSMIVNIPGFATAAIAVIALIALVHFW
jgi:hypothetical protein